MWNKYNARKVTVNGEKFDSRHEADRYWELSLLARAGKITKLRRQVPFLLLEAQYDDEGRLLERNVRYIADFVYEQDGKTVVEDAKGFKTDDYIIKRKLMLKYYGIRIKET